MINGQVPVTVSSLIKPNNSLASFKVNIPRPRIDLFKTSLSYSGSVLVNSLPANIRQLSLSTNVYISILTSFHSYCLKACT